MDKKTCKFNLNVAERIMLLMNLPEKGSVTEMISKRNIRNKIDFSSKEVEDFDLKTKNDKVEWSQDARSIEIEFTDSEMTFLKAIVDKMDKEGSITDNILEFAEKVVNYEN